MPRAIIFHSLDHARAALGAARKAGVEVCLVTAPGAARYAGVDHLKKIVDLALAEFEGDTPNALIDCGTNAGSAMSALRAGWNTLAFAGEPDVKRKIADMVAQCGARLVDRPAEALDLLDEPDPDAACRRWLSAPD